MKNQDDKPAQPQDAALLLEAPPSTPPDDELAEDAPYQEQADGATAGRTGASMSEGMRERLRALERTGTRQPARHRLALTGAAELDEARPRESRSGTFKLLEAVYQRGETHWLDPERALSPLKDILFKEGAPLGADRGIYYALTKLARAGISPAAFVTHVVLPRMGNDYNWRQWRSRHFWVLGSVADMLIELRSAAPWNSSHLGSSHVLADVALCKYVGRPLARVPSERLASQEEYLAAWANAWRGFAFTSNGFLEFMRRTVLPCLYRLSGRIDPEQLAPIARSLAALERTLGRRMAAMSPEAAELFLASAGLSDSFEARIEKRAASGAGAYALALELRGYAELASELSALDAGLAVLGRAAQHSLDADPGYLVDAATLVRALRQAEGASLVRWHIDALPRTSEPARVAFTAEVSRNGGLHPNCPHTSIPLFFERYSFDAEALAASLGLDPVPLRLGNGSPPDLPTIRRAWFAAHPEGARLFAELANAVASGGDRSWTHADAARLDEPGAGFHELAVRSLIPGLGTGFSLHSLKAPTLSTLLDSYGAAASGNLVDVSIRLRLGSTSQAGAGVDAAGKDAVRARVAVGLIESVWRVLVTRGGDAECGAVFAELGKNAAAARKRLADLGAPGTAGEGNDAKRAALESRLALMDAAFEAMKDVPPASKDPRRFALAVHLAAYFYKPGDDASLVALAGLVARYAADPTFSAIAARLATDVAPGFMGVEQAALVADAIDSLCAACAADGSIAAAINSAEGELATALRGSSRLKAGVASADSLDAALRRVSAYQRITAETAKWRDMLAKLETAKRPARSFTLRTSRTPLDAYYGDMGGICLSAMPELVLRPGVMVCRLWDDDEERIRGMCLFVYAAGPVRSAGIARFWYAFAFNPLRSLIRGMGSTELATLYLGFRTVAEEISRRSALPVLIPGLSERGIVVPGIVSNDGAFSSLVSNYERAAGSPYVNDASGFSVYYPRATFAEALIAVDPRKPESYRARGELEQLGAITRPAR
ncbi:MAG: hypothetical protein JXM71_04065 [Spirochaetales bacterium]|nr:hypothetical protein [Spirochaetales bacterium]